MPTKKVILIFVAGRSAPLKTVVSFHKWGFHSFLQKYSFFSKNFFYNKTSVI